MAENTTKADDGGSVFPLTGRTYGSNGMSLRDWFAGQALTGLLAKEGASGDAMSRIATGDNPECQASMFAGTDALRCYIYADAMLAARRGGAQ